MEKKIKEVIFNPSEFFEKIKKEKGIIPTFKYFVILSLVYHTFSSGCSFLSTPTPILDVLKNFLMSYVIGLITTFIVAGIWHVLVIPLGGKGNYSATYKALVYGSTLGLLFGWIPYIGNVFSFFSFYLQMIGISKLHKISMKRAFLIVFVFMILLVIGIISSLTMLSSFVPF